MSGKTRPGAGQGRRTGHGDSHDPVPETPRERQLILVVEDDPDDWEIYGKLLWYNGFDVIYARDGTEGLELARRHRPDLVVLDLLLPGLDGLEVCRELKGDSNLSGVPVLMLTGLAEADFGEQAREAGCERFMEKPQSPLEVLHEVERIIGQAPPDPAKGPPPDAVARDPADPAPPLPPVASFRPVSQRRYR